MYVIAKALYEAMKADKLDSVTKKTFKWVRNRKTAAEREAEVRLEGEDQLSDGTVPDHILQRDKLADKGRIRRFKEKVWRVLKMPKETQ